MKLPKNSCPGFKSLKKKIKVVQDVTLKVYDTFVGGGQPPKLHLSGSGVPAPTLTLTE